VLDRHRDSHDTDTAKDRASGEAHVPEIPDLEAIRGFLNARVLGVPVESAEIRIPVVARIPKAEFAAALIGTSMSQIERRGKFLLFELASDETMVINPMLTGRFQYVEPRERVRAKTCAVIGFANGRQLRYVDERLMGKLYLVPSGELERVPQFAEMGPDALDPALTEAVFRARIRRHPGQVKSILTNHRFVAGIGNAYADEILWRAGVHPYRKRTATSDDEIGRLYQAIDEVMQWAIPIVAAKMQDEIAYDEWREHLQVHRRGGQPCPRCGSPISEITAGQRITSFCRKCQP
jgi:formamidopyrimidine-DNA glycosylase